MELPVGMDRTAFIDIDFHLLYKPTYEPTKDYYFVRIGSLTDSEINDLYPFYTKQRFSMELIQLEFGSIHEVTTPIHRTNPLFKKFSFVSYLGLNTSYIYDGVLVVRTVEQFLDSLKCDYLEYIERKHVPEERIK